MPRSPDWTPFLEAGMQFTALTRAEAQRRAEQLVREGQLAQERAQSFVDEMVESSRRRADDFIAAVRGELQRQVESLGLATKEELERLEAKVSASKSKASKSKASKGKTAKGKASKGKTAKGKSSKKKSNPTKKPTKARAPKRA